MVTGLTSTSCWVLFPLTIGDVALVTKVPGGSGMAAGGGGAPLSGLGTCLQAPDGLRAALTADVADFGCAFDVDPEPHPWNKTAASTPAINARRALRVIF